MSATVRDSNPGVPRRQPNWLSVAASETWRRMRWPLAGAVMLALSSGLAWWIGMARYEAGGRPNDYEREREMQNTRMLVQQFFGYRHQSSYPFNLSLGMHEMHFPMTSRPWSESGSHRLERESASVVYQTNTLHMVSRYNLVFKNIDREVLRQIALYLSSINHPNAEAGNLDSSRGLYQMQVWRTPSYILTMETRQEENDLYTVIINGVGKEDPRYLTRWEDGGLGPSHPLLPEVRRQLGMTFEERVKEKPIPANAPLSPFLEW